MSVIISRKQCYLSDPNNYLLQGHHNLNRDDTNDGSLARAKYICRNVQRGYRRMYEPGSNSMLVVVMKHFFSRRIINIAIIIGTNFIAKCTIY